ncbi:YcjX family GTP-binding protein [Pseudooceanicola sediminis]|uniref:YcjX family protein n=1 Tax=Pseudooceanicola sediminis TaxID=2211117 RepID=UPI0018F48978|nr:YcjX family protein [Pseudooceanicola sediminis]
MAFGITSLTDGITRQIETVGDTLSETFFEPVIRLGVTGMARAGKTVFITSLVANLLNRSRMPQLLAEADNRILAAYLQPQPDDTLPRFDYEAHLAALTGPAPHWPESTRTISELRLSFRVRPAGLIAGLSGPRTVHLDIIDYPGEWLLDLPLMDKTYAEWSREVLARMDARSYGSDFLDAARAAAATGTWQEPDAQALARSYTAYLRQARLEGMSDVTPGRFLLPGEMEGSPVLTFAPLPPQDSAPRKSLWREMERRYEAYKFRVVKPFFQQHFARIDRQVVLVDALSAIHAGPAAVDDLNRGLEGILSAFRPGRNAWASRLLLGKRVEKILFAATKADHLHHTQHARLTAIMEALVSNAISRADFAGARTQAMSIASLRATVEETIRHEGAALQAVRGRLLDTGKQAAMYPGALPEDPSRITRGHLSGDQWLDEDYSIMSFAPADISLKPGEGPPHIRLDRAAQFLIGDRL